VSDRVFHKYYHPADNPWIQSQPPAVDEKSARSDGRAITHQALPFRVLVDEMCCDEELNCDPLPRRERAGPASVSFDFCLKDRFRPRLARRPRIVKTRPRHF
jgi:hypothetical protein